MSRALRVVLADGIGDLDALRVQRAIGRLVGVREVEEVRYEERGPSGTQLTPSLVEIFKHSTPVIDKSE